MVASGLLAGFASAVPAQLDGPQIGPGAVTSDQTADLAQAFQDSLLLGCVGQMAGTVIIAIDDEAAANKIGLSIGAPKAIATADFLPLVLGIPGGTEMFEHPLNDGYMVLAVGLSVCRIGIFDVPTSQAQEAIEQELTASGAPWVFDPEEEDAPSYRWVEPPFVNYVAKLRPQNGRPRLSYVVEVFKE